MFRLLIIAFKATDRPLKPFFMDLRHAYKVVIDLSSIIVGSIQMLLFVTSARLGRRRASLL